MKVVIVGGGPVGCYCGYLLASNGYSVDIFEEDKVIGKPVQCTGIVTKDVMDIIDHNILSIKPLNIINKARIHSTNNIVTFNLADNLIIDRTEFDSSISDLAKNAGARIHTGCKAKKVDKKSIYLEPSNNNSSDKIRYDILIGADGPLSIVAKYLRIKRKFWKGLQARVKLKNDNIVDFYLNIGTYAWKVPENDKILRVGGLTTKKQVEKLIGNNSIINWQAGLIPRYDPKTPIQRDNIYLVGDAAGQVKATTGGGLVPGLLAAQNLVDSIIYNRPYKGVNLWTHLKIRQILEKFSDKDYDKLLSLCDRRVKKVLSKYSRDQALNLAINLMIVQPRFLGFLIKLIK